jgi:tripartite-type tricarboxylate transporter receptor subunit TctC
MRRQFAGSIIACVLCIVGAMAIVSPAWAQFYQDKTIRFIIPYGPGGGVDARSRMFIRHFARLLPGQPKIVAQNMEGASGAVGANYMFNVAERDGLTLSWATREQAYIQLAQRAGVQFDVAQFAWIGSVLRQGQLAFIRTELPYQTLQDLRAATEPLVWGVRRAGSADYLAAKAVEALGVALKIVPGYGTRKRYLAFQSGEINMMALTWSSLGASGWLEETPLARIIVEIGAPGAPDVPTWREFEPLPGQEAVYALVNQALALPTDGLLAPPGTPPALVETLRAAFDALVRDPEFLADAKKFNIDVNPVDGAALTKLYADFVDATPETQALFKSLTQ